MTSVFPNQQKKKASQLVIYKLQGMIDNRELRPGDRLPPERELAKEFEVSRPTIRGAIQSLGSIGFLTTIQGSGTFVAQVDDSLVLENNPIKLMVNIKRFSGEELYEARISLEMSVGGLAVERANGEDIAGMAEELMEMFSNFDSPRDYLIHDMRFHQKIAASQNRILTAMLNILISILFDCFTLNSQEASNFKETTELNQKVYQAIRDKNAKAARQLIRDNLQRMKAFHNFESSFCG